MSIHIQFMTRTITFLSKRFLAVYLRIIFLSFDGVFRYYLIHRMWQLIWFMAVSNWHYYF